MPSEDGFKESLPSARRARAVDWNAFKAEIAAEQAAEPLPVVTTEEQARIADGEPYCFRCGRPASSFSEYCERGDEGCRGPVHPEAVEYVKHEEGTYNPKTNRFACDACYIAIGMPVGEPGDAYGWKAP
jgi:hypothetical protein